MGLSARDHEQLAVRAGSLQEALATTTEDRLVFRGGQLLRRTSVTRDPSTEEAFRA